MVLGSWYHNKSCSEQVPPQRERKTSEAASADYSYILDDISTKYFVTSLQSTFFKLQLLEGEILSTKLVYDFAFLFNKKNFVLIYSLLKGKKKSFFKF